MAKTKPNAKLPIYHIDENMPVIYDDTERALSAIRAIDISNIHKSYKGRGSRRVTYYDMPMTYDSETTSTYLHNEKAAWVYGWSMCVGNVCIIGRSWQDLLTVCEAVSDHFHLTDDLQLICWVHNFSFDFRFLIDVMSANITEIFATDPHKPVSVKTIWGITFRCSYKQSLVSVAKLGEDLLEHNVRKAAGDLDYALVRHWGTPLTAEEIHYMANDVIVLAAWVEEKMKQEGGAAKITLTKTGEVRRYFRRRCFKSAKYRHTIRRLIIPTVDDYDMMREAFQGGFTHAHDSKVGQVWENVASIDIASSYPTVICAEKYPMSPPKEVTIKTGAELRWYLDHKLLIMRVRLDNVVAKEGVPDHILSRSRCKVDPSGELVVDNGRIVKATSLRTTITSVDLIMLRRFYTFELHIGRVLSFHPDYLPTEIVSGVLELYGQKTSYKGRKDKAVEYAIAKGNINSTYGMMCQDPLNTEVKLVGGEWIEIPPNKEEAIEAYNEDPQRFLYYAWGVFVTAYARRNLYYALLEMGDDYIYADTDSNKILNFERHKAWVDRYNEWITDRLDKVLTDHHGLSADLSRPLTVKGQPKQLGVFEFEGTYDRFKTLGAKRYMTEKNGKIEITVAGVPKKEGSAYMSKYGEFAFDTFADGLVFDESVGKKTRTYLSTTYDEEVVDYLGNIGHITVTHAVHLEPTRWTMGIGMEWLEYLEKLEGGQ